MRRSRQLTAREIEGAKRKARDYWLTDAAIERGIGRLVLRVGASGSKRWYFKVETDGRREYRPLGDYAPPPRPGEAPAGLSLDAARDKARELSNLHREHGSLRDHFAAQAKAQHAAEAATQAQQAEAERRAQEQSVYTLRALLDAYTAHLERLGKISAGDVRRAFALYVNTKPLADKPARDVTGRELSALLRELVESGKGRTAAKLRSLLAAAFTLAARAESDPTAPSALLAFNIESDPMSAVAARGFAQFTRARDRTLTAGELRAYWKRVKALAGVHGDALRLQCLLGGQRVAQLVRAEVGDFDSAGELLTLRDPKGRRSEPRRHVLPLVGPALGIVQRLAAERRAAVDKDHPTGWRYLLASEPDKCTRPETLDKAFAEVLAAMRAAGELENDGFQLRDVRRTAETLLAAEGVSAEVRAHLQSHGLGGVQQRHYVKHTFAAEKRAALLKWHRLLGLRVAEAPKAAPVAELAKARRARGRNANPGL
jgi:hypothetical protein